MDFKRLFIIPLLLFSSVLFAETYYVATDGDDGTGDGSSGNEWLTIQKAADNVSAGDTVIVRDGTYTATGTPFIRIYTEATEANPVVFMAENDTMAVLNGDFPTINPGICFQIDTISSHVVVDGFEITNFYSAGFSCNNKHGAIVEGITIRGVYIHHMGRTCTDSPNAAGTGIFMAGVNDLVIDSCIFHDLGRYGPGEEGCSPSLPYYKNHDHAIYADNIDGAEITNNIFYNINRGHPVKLCTPPYNNIKIYNNTCDFGNMWYTYGSHVKIGDIEGTVDSIFIYNNIFNTCNDRAVYLYRADLTTYTNVFIRHNIIHGGLGEVAWGVVEFPISGVTIDSNLTDTDPLFIDNVNYDFELQSESPAIDTGLDVGYGDDLGVYQYVGASPEEATITLADLSSGSARKATIIGNVTHDGGGTVSARGVTWDTSTNPDIGDDSFTASGSGTGTYSIEVSGLSPSTTYYFRCYATNEAGTAYSDNYTLTTPAKSTLNNSDKWVIHNGKVVKY